MIEFGNVELNLKIKRFSYNPFIINKLKNVKLNLNLNLKSKTWLT